MRREAHLTYYLNRLHTFHGHLASQDCIAANATDANRKAECAESVLSSLTAHMEQAGFLSRPRRAVSWNFAPKPLELHQFKGLTRY
jgi:hypothetical protein